jgi:hypothetical protein
LGQVLPNIASRKGTKDEWLHVDSRYGQSRRNEGKDENKAVRLSHRRALMIPFWDMTRNLGKMGFTNDAHSIAASIGMRANSLHAHFLINDNG